MATSTYHMHEISPYESALFRYPDVPEDCKKHLDNYVPCDRLPDELRPGTHWLDRPKWFYGMGAVSTPDTPLLRYALKHPELRLVDYCAAGVVVPGARGRVLISQTLTRVFRHVFLEMEVTAPPPQLCYDETKGEFVVVAQLFDNYSRVWKEDDYEVVETVKELRRFFGLGEAWQPMWHRQYRMEDPMYD